MGERQAFESSAIAVRTVLVVAGIGLVFLTLSLLSMTGLYRLWVNGKEGRVQPHPVANASAPRLDTYLFRERHAPAPPYPVEVRAQGYRWRDAAHTRVRIPVERAMGMVAVRGPRGFDPPLEGSAP